MLCLTIYEAKGLEFEDVIIYDFFKESPVKANSWKLFKDISYALE
jgi:DNA helicase IV